MMSKAECNLVYFRVGTSDWGTPRETSHLQVCFLAPNNQVAVCRLARDPVLKAQPYRVVVECGNWALKRELMEGPDEALLMCITTAINLINVSGLGCFHGLGVPGYLRGIL